MRLKVRRLWRAIRQELPIQFGHEQLTSYGGLELVRRYFHLIGLNARIRCTLDKHAGGDYGGTHLVLLVIGLLVAGARRLQHLRYLTNDSLFARFCGLSRIPSDRTVVNWLKQFTQASLGALARINSELLYEQIQKLELRRLTIDLDGTVIGTGDQVAWAARGFNPHHPKDPSYYPLLAHLAQTGQILRLKNRPGNVHDSKGAERFVRELIGELRARLGRALMRLNSELLYEQIQKLGLRRLTIDLDGTVIGTGGKVAWAMRGFNPHHPKDPSYYPLLAHLAQTGQILRLKNRPGNVHDSKGAERFVRELIGELRARLGRALTLEFRMDAAFFQQNLLKLLTRLGCFYAVKVPLCRWTGVKALIAAQARWTAVAGDIDGFETQLEAGGLGTAVAGGGLPQADSSSEPEELPARPVLTRRRLLRILRGGDQSHAHPADAVVLRRRPRGAGKDLRRTQGRVCPRRRAHQPLRRQ